uniref:Uncharacterized protein n=1 Tax=Acrobeloides nanus TaxID=290746 RepID=A0A914DK64_9BILA
MTLTRGLPFAAFCMGTIWFAQKNLPAAYRVGLRPWIFYPLVGLGALSGANMLSMPKCIERAQPKLMELYTKYETQSAAGQTSHVTYDQLRQRNRGGGQEPPLLDDGKHLSQFYTEPTFISGTPISSGEPAKKPEFNEEFSFK